MCGTGVASDTLGDGVPGVSEVRHTYHGDGKTSTWSNWNPESTDSGNPPPPRPGQPPAIPRGQRPGTAPVAPDQIATTQTYIDPFGNVQQGVGRSPLSVGADEWARIANNPLLAAAFRRQPATGQQITASGAQPSQLSYLFGTKPISGTEAPIDQTEGSRRSWLESADPITASSLAAVEQQRRDPEHEEMGGEIGVGEQTWGSGFYGASDSEVVDTPHPPGTPQQTGQPTEVANPDLLPDPRMPQFTTERESVVPDVNYVLATPGRQNLVAYTPGDAAVGTNVGSLSRNTAAAENIGPLFDQPSRRTWGNTPMITV